MAELIVLVKHLFRSFSHVSARRIRRTAVRGGVVRHFSGYPEALARLAVVVCDQGTGPGKRQPGSGDVQVSPYPQFGDTLRLSTLDNRLFL